MPASPFYHRDDDRDATTITLAASDMSLRDHTPLYSYDDHVPFEPMISEADSMIFGLDLDDALQQESKPPFSWDPAHVMHYNSMSTIPFPGSPDSTTSQLDPAMPSHTRRFDSTFSTTSSGYFPPSSPEFNESTLYSNWIADPDAAPHSSSVPIPIPAGHAQPQSPLSSSYAAFSENSSIFPDVTPFSPTTAYAALQPLPLSPPEDTVMMEQLRAEVSGTVSPPANLYEVNINAEPPSWASHLWDPTPNIVPPGGPVPIGPLSDDNFATARARVPVRRGTPVAHLFQSSSAPSPSHARPPLQSRPYSTRRSESISEHDDRDATVRKKKRPVDEVEEADAQEKRSESRESSSPIHTPPHVTCDIDTSMQLPSSPSSALPNWRPRLGSSTSPTGSSATRLPVTRSSTSRRPLKRPARNTLGSLPRRRRCEILLRVILDRL